MFDENIKAHLVFDGKLTIPQEMGVPAADQIQGTILEQLSELCCRICYDSCGKGRSSEKMHEHLLEVKHWSVYEHAHFTVELNKYYQELDKDYILALLNRPELGVNIVNGKVQITLNFRHILDWHRWTKYYPNYNKEPENGISSSAQDVLYNIILNAVYQLAPRVLTKQKLIEVFRHDIKDYDLKAKLVEPTLPSQKFVTLFLSGSRGWSHEQVRHRFNMSQRSTRYVDEDGSQYVQHPLISKYLSERPQQDFDEFGKDIPSIQDIVENQLNNAIDKSREAYAALVRELQEFCIEKGIDKFTARKQARGAARNYLGNGLLTEMMFTASLPMWRSMLEQRCSAAADAEIRLVYNDVLKCLRASAYSEYFGDLNLTNSPDGLGQVLSEVK